MANPWVMKRELSQELLGRIGFDLEVSLIDSFPLPVFRFARAYRCRCLRGEAACGKDALIKQTFYGFRVRVRLAWPELIMSSSLALARALMSSRWRPRSQKVHAAS
jgi:hypothetical protein